MGFTSAVGVGNLKTGIVTNTGTIATPYDGQVVYETDNNLVKAYNGSSWESVGATTGGLVLISTTTIGSAVSTVTVTNAFSATYDNYKIVYCGGASSSAAPDIHMTLGASATSYYSLRAGWRYTNAALDFVDANNGTKWLVGGAADSTPVINIDVMGPNLAVNTYFQGVFNAASGMAVTGGYHDATTQHTDFTITPGAGTFTGGKIFVYGYKN